MKDITSFIVSASIGVCVSFITAYVTSKMQIHEERKKWKKDFAIKYAEVAASDPKMAQSIAKQLALGIIIVELKDGTKRERIFIPPNCRMIAGRSTDNDINISDNAISRKHCSFLSDDNSVSIEDLGSANGVFLNGSRLVKSSKLQSGDIISIGTTQVTYMSL